ncbi:MAG: hypothetical protein R2880_13385 [Deinococcales bacterium]
MCKAIWAGAWGFIPLVARWGGVVLPSLLAMLLIPFLFGIAMTFYNAKNILGWILWIGSVIALVFGVLQSTRFVLNGLSAFELLLILVLTFGGLGIFLASLRDMDLKHNRQDRFWP